MALNYEVKKRVFGFDKTKTEKYVAQLKTLGMVEFEDLCDEVTKGDFGCFRPGLNAKSQDKEEDVKSDTVYRRKIIFTPGQQFKEMLTRASVTRAGWDNSEVASGGGSNPGTGGNGEEEENPLG